MCSGSIIGSKIISKKIGIILTIFGYVTGLLAEGDMLRKGIYSIMPIDMMPFLIIALAIAIIIFIIAHKIRVPQSLSVNFTSILLGISLAAGLRINWGYVAIVLAFWIIAPIISIVMIGLLMHSTHTFTRKRKIWSTVKWIRAMLVVLSFFAAFTLGANTIGLIYSALPKNYYSLTVIVLAIIFGSIFLSSGELKRIGDEIIPLRYINAINSQFVSVTLVEIATLFAIPLSNTQTFIASLYGSGLSYRNRILLKKPLKSIAFIWIGGAITSLALAYFFSLAFLTI
ncbi:MAG: inorganic phosphate transporter [Candidatus Micrarchaeia archaeon]